MAFQKSGLLTQLAPVRGKLSHMGLNYAADYAEVKRKIFTLCYIKGRECQ